MLPMQKDRVNPHSLFPSLQHGFSQIVTVRGGKTVYISGQTAWDANKRIVGGNDLGEQARQALRNGRIAVGAVGGTLADVVSLRIYVVNYKTEEAESVGEALREFFSAEGHPAPTWVGGT